MKQIFFTLVGIITALYSCQNSSDENNNLSAKVKHELSSEFFQELYSNTYYDLIDRIEPDGFLEESKTGQYGGMYLRTVGAIVPLLIETNELKHAEHLINCAFDAMNSNRLNRIPHVINRKIDVDKAVDSINNPYQIIGRTDQIDGQAHVILAWALLALHRGESDFENKTWHIAADLMTRSTQKPYFGLEKEGTISNLIHNYNFEHSRPGISHYNILTQCFIGSALESMISIAERRNENELASLWKERIKTLQEGVQQHMIRKVDDKEVYYELLSKEDNANTPFYGMGWVNLSPIAAQWEPLSHHVFVNTIKELRKGIQTWNGIKWMPTDIWADGTFFGQMIGKGIAWEIEYCRKEKEWKRIDEILEMFKIIQYKHPIYMENAHLTNGIQMDQQHLTKTKLKELEQGIWKVADPGNGEQVSWWCWAMARLRKEMGLNPVPERVVKKKQVSKSKKENGLMYLYIINPDQGPRVSGIDTIFNVNAIPLISDNSIITWTGYLKIDNDDEYRFFSYSTNPSKLWVNNKLVYTSSSHIQLEQKDNILFLKKGFYPIELTYDHILPDEQLEVYFQKGVKPLRELLSTEYLYYSMPEDNISIPPIIEPAIPEIEKGKNIIVSIKCPDENGKVFYTLDGSNPDENSTSYNNEFLIDKSTTVKAINKSNGLNKSAVSYIKYKEVPKKTLYEFEYPPHPKHAGGKTKILSDNIEGSTKFDDGKWLGFGGDDFILTINFQQVRDIYSIKTNFLHNQSSWIFAPEVVYFYVSLDGENYKQVMERKFNTSDSQSHQDPEIISYKKTIANTKAKFVRIIGKNIKFLPPWHSGKGKAWIFVDEISINE